MTGRFGTAPLLGIQRGDQVYAAVRDGITSGRYLPGSKLVIEELALSLRVSITPVRDALSRLESQGLVVRVPYQGSFVKSFSAREIQDLYEVRASLEALAVTLACARIETGQMERLRAAQHGGEAALAASDFAAYQEHNHAFHATILAASGNELLERTMSNIALQMQMVIAQTIKLPGRPGRAVKEHLMLIERLEARDAAGAEAVIRRHVYGALEDLRLGPRP